jgi:predicted transcriptional regulator
MILLALLVSVCIVPVFVSSAKAGMLSGTQPVPAARDDIYSAIQQIPGINLRGIMYEINRTNGVVQYNLGQLQAQREVFTANFGNLKGYFPACMNKRTKKELVALVAARHAIRYAILEVLINGPKTVSEIASAAGLCANKIVFHAQKLEEEGILDIVDGTPHRMQIAAEVLQALQQFVFF